MEGQRKGRTRKRRKKDGLSGRTDRDWRGKAMKLWKFSGGMGRKKTRQVEGMTAGLNTENDVGYGSETCLRE